MQAPLLHARAALLCDVKVQDREAIRRVKSAATQNFAQHIFYLQNTNRKHWDFLWRSIRLRCTDCEGGYLRANRRTAGTPLEAQCVECNSNVLDRKHFWIEKAKIAAHLFAAEDQGELWPYILVEPKPLRVPA